MFDTLMLNSKTFIEIGIHQEFWKRFGDIAEKVSQLIMLGSAELLVGDQTVLVLVLVGKDLFHQLVLVLHHLASLLALLSSGVLHRLHLLLQVAADLVPAERVVSINVDLLEDVDRGGALPGVDQLDFKVEGSSTRDDVTSTLVSITKSRRDDQLPLLTDAHAEHTLLPALDHLTNSDLELERLASVVTRVELGSRLEGAHVVHGEHVSVPSHLVAGVRLRDVLHLQA